MAWMPYSPNETVVPPVAWPLRPGWCCLRCLTLRGINMALGLHCYCCRSSVCLRSGRGCRGSSTTRSAVSAAVATVVTTLGTCRLRVGLFTSKFLVRDVALVDPDLHADA